MDATDIDMIKHLLTHKQDDYDGLTINDFYCEDYYAYKWCSADLFYFNAHDCPPIVAKYLESAPRREEVQDYMVQKLWEAGEIEILFYDRTNGNMCLLEDINIGKWNDSNCWEFFTGHPNKNNTFYIIHKKED